MSALSTPTPESAPFQPIDYTSWEASPEAARITGPLEKILAFDDRTRKDLFRAGLYDSDTEAEIVNAGADQALRAGHITDKSQYAPTAKPKDPNFLARQLINKGDTEKASAIFRYQSFLSRPDTDPVTLERARQEAELDPDTENELTRAAVRSGEIPFAVVPDKDGNAIFELDPELGALDREQLLDLAESVPGGFDPRFLPALEKQFTRVEGTNYTAAQFRQAGVFDGFLKEQKRTDEFLHGELEKAQDEYNRTGQLSTETQESLDRTLAALDADNEFAPATRSRLIRDTIKRASKPEGYDPENPQQHIQYLEDGTVWLPEQVIFDQAKHDQVLDSLSVTPEQKEAAKKLRAGRLESIAPAMVDAMGANPDALDFFEKSKAAGKSDSEIATEWYSKPDNYSWWGNRARSIGMSIDDAFVGLVQSGAAVLGSESAREGLQARQQDIARNREYARLSGDSYGVGMTTLNAVTPMVADLLAGLLVSAVATPVAGVAVAGARTAASSLLRSMARTAIREGGRGAVRSLVRTGTESAARTLATLGDDLVSEMARKVGGEVAERAAVRGATRAIAGQTGVAASSFTRSAGSAYVQAYSALDAQTNAQGQPLYSDEEKRKIALGTAMTAGTATAAITLGFGKILGGGVEDLVTGKIGTGILKRVFGATDDQIVSATRTSALAILKAAGAEAPEEAADQLVGNVIQALGTGEEFRLGPALKEALEAGLVGGLLGAGTKSIEVGIDKYRDAKVVALEKANAPAAAAALEARNKAAATTPAAKPTVINQDGLRIQENPPLSPDPFSYGEEDPDAQPGQGAPLVIPQDFAPLSGDLSAGYGDEPAVGITDTAGAVRVSAAEIESQIDAVDVQIADLKVVPTNETEGQKVRRTRRLQELNAEKTRLKAGVKNAKASGGFVLVNSTNTTAEQAAIAAETEVAALDEEIAALSIAPAKETKAAATKREASLEKVRTARAEAATIAQTRRAAAPIPRFAEGQSDPRALDYGAGGELTVQGNALGAPDFAPTPVRQRGTGGAELQVQDNTLAGPDFAPTPVRQRGTGGAELQVQDNTLAGTEAVPEDIIGTDQAPEPPDVEVVPEPAPQPARGVNNAAPQLQGKGAKVAGMVEAILASGASIDLVASREDATARFGLPPSTRKTNTIATAYVRTDGTTGLLLYPGALKLSPAQLAKVLAHERIHLDQYAFEATPEGEAAATEAESVFDKDSPGFDKALDSLMRKEYPSWDQLPPRSKLREATRAAVEGLMEGETSHFKKGLFSYIGQFLKHVQAIFEGDTAMTPYVKALVVAYEQNTPAAAQALAPKTPKTKKPTEKQIAAEMRAGTPLAVHETLFNDTISQGWVPTRNVLLNRLAEAGFGGQVYGTAFVEAAIARIRALYPLVDVPKTAETKTLKSLGLGDIKGAGNKLVSIPVFADGTTAPFTNDPVVTSWQKNAGLSIKVPAGVAVNPAIKVNSRNGFVSFAINADGVKIFGKGDSKRAGNVVGDYVAAQNKEPYGRSLETLPPVDTSVLATRVDFAGFEIIPGKTTEDDILRYFLAPSNSGRPSLIEQAVESRAPKSFTADQKESVRSAAQLAFLRELREFTLDVNSLGSVNAEGFGHKDAESYKAYLEGRAARVWSRADTSTHWNSRGRPTHLSLFVDTAIKAQVAAAKIRPSDVRLGSDDVDQATALERAAARNDADNAGDMLVALDEAFTPEVLRGSAAIMGMPPETGIVDVASGVQILVSRIDSVPALRKAFEQAYLATLDLPAGPSAKRAVAIQKAKAMASDELVVLASRSALVQPGVVQAVRDAGFFKSLAPGLNTFPDKPKPKRPDAVVKMPAAPVLAPAPAPAPAPTPAPRQRGTGGGELQVQDNTLGAPDFAPTPMRQRGTGGGELQVQDNTLGAPDFAPAPATEPSPPMVYEGGALVPQDNTLAGQEWESTPVSHTVAATSEQSLTPEEKAVAAKELGFPTWTPEARTSFVTRFTDWFASGGKLAVGALLPLFNKVRVIIAAGTLAMTSMISINDATPRDIRSISPAKIAEAVATPKVKQAAAPAKRAAPVQRLVDFDGVSASSNVRVMAQWILDTKDSDGQPFVVAEKVAGVIYVFSGDGVLVKKAPALFGATPGDIQTQEQRDLTIEQRRTTKAAQVTEAGRFPSVISNTGDSYGDTAVFNPYKHTISALHIPYLGRPAENRLGRMASPTAEDNRISLGCVNIPAEAMSAVASQFRDGGVIYILPETEAGKQLYPGFANLDIPSEMPATSPDMAARARMDSVAYLDQATIPAIREDNRAAVADLQLDGDLRSAIERIARSAKYPRRYRAIMLAALKMQVLPNISIVDAPAEAYAGSYTHSARLITLNLASSNGRGMLDVLAHELLHAATLEAIANPQTKAAKELLARLERARQKAAEVVPSDMSYAVSSIDEFITHAATDPRLQVILRETFEKGKTTWQRVVDAVAKFFGIANPDFVSDLWGFINHAAEYGLRPGVAASREAASPVVPRPDIRYSMPAPAPAATPASTLLEDTKAKTVAGTTVGTRNPTSKTAAESGTDPKALVDRASMRRDPELYRKNAVMLADFPLVAGQVPEAAQMVRKIKAPVIEAQAAFDAASVKLEKARAELKAELARRAGVRATAIKVAEVDKLEAGETKIARGDTAIRGMLRNIEQARKAQEKARDKRTAAGEAFKAASKTLMASDRFPIELADRVYDAIETAAIRNLELLIELFPAALRDTARLWYDGANIIAQKFAADFNTTLNRSSAVLAVFSPQKDWFMNVALAKRMMKVWANHQNTPFDGQMAAQYLKRAGEPEPIWDKKANDHKRDTEGNITYTKGAKPVLDDEGNITGWTNWSAESAREKFKKAEEDLAAMRGKTLAELPIEFQARFIRMWSEVYDSSNFPIVSPDGSFGDNKLSEKGNPQRIAWGSYVTIEKAIAIMTAPEANEMQVISDELGVQHKVRSFYNNIVDPANTDGHVTMDTHAIAAILWQALSGNSPEVTMNFGGGGASGSSNLGVSGLYPAFAEAYRKVAEKFGLLPREIQSITWESVRLLFPAKFKSQKANVEKVREIWRMHELNLLTTQQAHDRIFQIVDEWKRRSTLAGQPGRTAAEAVADGTGVGDPDWAEIARRGQNNSGAPPVAPDAGGLPAGGRRGDGAGRPAVGRRGAGRDAGLLPGSAAGDQPGSVLGALTPGQDAVYASFMARYKDTPSVEVTAQGRAFSPIVRDLLNRRAAGEAIPRFVLDRAVKEHFPSRPIVAPKSLAELPSEQEVFAAVRPNQQKNHLEAEKAGPPAVGSAVTVRQDVPAWTDNKVGVVTTVYKVGKETFTTYRASTKIENPVFDVTKTEKLTEPIGRGENKKPHITVSGTWSADQSIPTDLESWTQVGFNPDRHSYYYERGTERMVVGGRTAFQIGNTVFVKDAVFDDAGQANTRYALTPEGAALDGSRSSVDQFLPTLPAGVSYSFDDTRPKYLAFARRSQPGVVTINKQALAAVIAGLSPANARAIVSKIVKHEIAHLAAFSTFTDADIAEMARGMSAHEINEVARRYYDSPDALARLDADLESGAITNEALVEEYLRMQLELATDGATTEATIAFHSNNPGFVARLVRYLKDALVALWRNVAGPQEDYVNRIAISRLAREYRAILRGHKPLRAEPFDPADPNRDDRYVGSLGRVVSARSTAEAVIQKGEEIEAEDDYLNCEFFCNKMVGSKGFKTDFSKEEVEISSAEEASAKLQAGDVIAFDGVGGSPARHYAVYISDGQVYEVEQWGAKPRVVTLAKNLEEYEVVSQIYRAKSTPRGALAPQTNTDPDADAAIREIFTESVEDFTTPYKPGDMWRKLFVTRTGDRRFPAISDKRQSSLVANERLVFSRRKQLNAAIKTEKPDAQVLAAAAGDTSPTTTPEQDAYIATEFAAAMAEARGIEDPAEQATAIAEAYELKQRLTTAAYVETARIKKRRIDEAFAELERTAPKTAANLKAMREGIDNISRIVKEYQPDASPLRMVLGTQEGIYLTRVYKIHHKDGDPLSIMSDPTMADVRERAQDQLMESIIKYRTAEIIEQEAEAGKTIGETEAREAALAEAAEQDLGRILLEDYLLSHGSKALPHNGSDFRTDLTRFFKKMPVPEALRHVLEEVTDPVELLTRTGLNVGMLAASTVFTRDLARAGFTSGAMVTGQQWASYRKLIQEPDNDKYLAMLVDNGWAKRKPAAGYVEVAPDVHVPAWLVKAKEDRDLTYVENFRKVSTTTKKADAGKLADLYAHPDVAAWMEHQFTKQKAVSTDDAKLVQKIGEVFAKATGTSLGIATLGSVGFYSRNLVGTAFFLAANGINPFSAKSARASKLAVEAFLNRESGEVTKLTGIGVLNDDLRPETIKELLKGETDRPGGLNILELIGKVLGGKKGVEYGAKTTAGLAKLAELATAIDGIAKATAYYAELETMREAYPDKSAKWHEDEAAKVVKLTHQAKSQTPPFIDSLTSSSYGRLFAPFLRFKGEMFRLTGNIIAQSAAEIRSDNPAIRARGYKRAAGFAMIAAFSVAGPALISAMYGVGDDEEYALREALPPYLRGNSIIYRPSDDGKSIQSYDFTYLNPFSFVGDPISRMGRAVMRGEPGDGMDELAIWINSNFLSEQILAGAVGEVLRNEDSDGRPITFETDSADEKLIKFSKHLVGSSFTPQSLKALQRSYDTARRGTPEDTPFYETAAGIVVGHAMPLRPRAFETEALALKAARKQAETNRQVRALASQLKRRVNFTDGDIEDIVADLQDSTASLNQDIARMIAGYQGLGLDDAAIAKQLVESGRSREFARAIVFRGIAAGPSITPATRRDMYEAGEKAGGPGGGEKRTRAVAEAMRQYEKVQQVRGVPED